MLKTLQRGIQLLKPSGLFQQLVEKMGGKKNKKKKTFGVTQSIKPVTTSYVLKFSADVLLLCPIDLRQHVQSTVAAAAILHRHRVFAWGGGPGQSWLMLGWCPPSRGRWKITGFSAEQAFLSPNLSANYVCASQFGGTCDYRGHCLQLNYF